MAVVNFAGFRDFSPALCATRLRSAGIDATPASAPLPAWDHDRYFTGVELARAIDDAGFRRRLAPGLARAAAGAEVVVVPAVLGLNRGHEPWADLQALVGAPLVEAATAPPSIPGLRLFAAYRARLEGLGVRWQFGFPAVGVERDGDRVTAVRSEGASRVLATRCQELVLATGGVAGNGIEANRDGTLTERVAGLPVDGFEDRLAYLGGRFLGDHPLAAAGVRVDAELRPVDASGEPLAGQHPLRRRPARRPRPDRRGLPRGGRPGHRRPGRRPPRRHSRPLTPEAAVLHVEQTADRCIKCNICNTVCPVSAVTDLFPGPKYEGPQGQRFRAGIDTGESPDKSLDYCSACGLCTQACPEGVMVAEINQVARSRLVADRGGLNLRDQVISRPSLMGADGQAGGADRQRRHGRPAGPGRWSRRRSRSTGARPCPSSRP